RREPDGHQARDRQGGREGRRGAEGHLHADEGQEGDRPGRDHFGEQRRRDREPDRGRDGEGRQGRRDHGRGGEGPRDDPRDGRGDAVRPWLPVAVLRDGPGADGGGPGGSARADPRQEDQRDEGSPPDPREGRADGPSAPDHRGGRRG